MLDEYANRAYDDFYPYELDPHGQETEGRLNEPHGVGFPLLIAPAYALGGAKAVELFLAAIAALGIALAYRLALRVAPDPWAIGAALAVGLSPPLLAYGSAVYPELAAAAALAGAALLAVRLDTRVTWRDASLCFVLLGALPWLGTKFVLAGVVVGVFAVRAVWRARRRTLAVGVVEVALFSVALYVALNEAIYSGPTPYAADDPGETATDASFPGGYLARAYRLVALFVDSEYGLLRWAPVFLLAFAGLWWLWRSRRDLLARAVPDVRETELAAGLCAAVLGAQLVVAAFLAPTMFGFWFPPRHLLAALPLAIPLVAWGLRHMPRVGLRPGRADGGRVRLALRGRALGRRLAGRRPAGCAVRPAHRRAAALHDRGRVAVLAGRRGRGGGRCTRPAGGAGGAPLAPDRGRHARQVLRDSGRTSGRSCGGGRRSGPPRPRCPRPRARG